MTTPSPPPPAEPLTEAAGLLASGAIFPRRVGLRSRGSRAAGAEILLGFKRGGGSLYFGDAPIYHFDPDGRWQRAFVAGVHYLKSLDARVQAVDRVRDGDRMVLRRRTLAEPEAADLDARIAAHARSLAAAVRAEAHDLLAPPAPSAPIEIDEVLAILSKIGGWDAVRWGEHRVRYRLAFGGGPPPFLPPDCPNPLILRPTAAMDAGGVADHARLVVELLGGRLDQCRDVFLAGGGWVDRPGDDAVALLATIGASFPIRANQGRSRALDPTGVDAPRFEIVHGAIDDPAVVLGRNHPWPALRAAHLGRVLIRVEGGTPNLAGSIAALVATLKDADIGIGLAVTLGADPDPALARLVAALPLARGDLITLIAGPDAPADLPLDAWKARIAADLPTPGPRVVLYNPDKQWI